MVKKPTKIFAHTNTLDDGHLMDLELESMTDSNNSSDEQHIDNFRVENTLEEGRSFGELALIQKKPR